jgi:ketosteroid isomerase-like protein
MPDDSVVLVRRFVEAFGRLGVEEALGYVHPEVELCEWPTAPGARTYHGHEGVRQAVDTWFESWEWMRSDIDEVFEVDDKVVVTLQQRAKGKGSEVEVEIRSFNVFTVRDSKVIGIELFTEREAAMEAAGITANHQQEEKP